VINVQVSNGMLRVRLSGWDAFATCWRRSWEYEVPVGKIARVYVRPAKPAIGIKSRTAWGPRSPELRRIRARRPSLWVDLSGERSSGWPSRRPMPGSCRSRSARLAAR
jgi:hypothetical protein